LTGRRVCPKCGATFHVAFAAPRTEDRCDNCRSELVQREDDREATVRNRLAVYARQTAPLLDHYRARNLLTSVAGEGDIGTVRSAVRKAAGLSA
jgi:adenylate kinase